MSKKIMSQAAIDKLLKAVYDQPKAERMNPKIPPDHLVWDTYGEKRVPVRQIPPLSEEYQKFVHRRGGFMIMVNEYRGAPVAPAYVAWIANGLVPGGTVYFTADANYAMKFETPQQAKELFAHKRTLKVDEPIPGSEKLIQEKEYVIQPLVAFNCVIVPAIKQSTIKTLH